MEGNSLIKASVFALLISLVVIGAWEIHLRNQGFPISYDDDNGSLWANKRKQVYEPMDNATVFIGSSRNKFDIDLATWKKLTGENPVQLAIEGNSPLPILEDLAKDEKFKGKLVIDVTEGLFFSRSNNDLDIPKMYIGYYKKETPAQKASFVLNHFLESQFVFLDKKTFSINALLDDANIPNRKGVFTVKIFPPEFTRVNFGRQVVMMKRLETDTAIQNKVKGIWYFYSTLPHDPPMSATSMDSMLTAVKSYTDKIKSRGGKVLFVRTPSSGPYLQAEMAGFPRQQYWERILEATQTPGIHFQDYPATSHFVCPEFSHLKQPDAITWTTNLVQIMQTEKGWSFPNANASN